MEFYVYIYYDPSRNKEPIYVGKGKNDRAWKHLKSIKKHPFIQRLNYMKEHNIKPIIGIYSGLDEEFAFLLEMELISKFGRKDLNRGPLLNLTDGGDGSINVSQETRKKMSLNNLGKILSKETCLKMSASRKGRIVSESTRKKISESNKGKTGHMTGKNHREDSKIKSSKTNSLIHKGKKRNYNPDGSWSWIFQRIN